jgi:hypothetical protein
VISGRSYLFSPDCCEKVSGNFAARGITSSSAIALAENDWQPQRLPYNRVTSNVLFCF